MSLTLRTSAACAFAIVSGFVWSPCLLGASPEGPSTDAAHVAKMVVENYKRFRDIPNLTVEFEMMHELLAGSRRFAFDTVRIITNRRGEKQRLRIKATARNTLVVDRDCA